MLLCQWFFSLGFFCYSQTLQQKIQTLIPQNTYQTNENFIKKIFSNEKNFYDNGNLNVSKIISTLKNNGLLSLKLSKPSDISISFRINFAGIQTDSLPSFMFLSYATSNLLTSMGYSYFYTSQAKKDHDRISLTYMLNTESNIDPVVVINNLSKRGYRIVNVTRDSPLHWIYDVSLRQSSLVNADIVKQGESELSKINGKYWLTLNDIGVLNIAPRESGVKWYPKILIFDANMDVIDSVMLTNATDNYKIQITNQAQYIMITDNYNANILRNGIMLNFQVK
ncbi:hypothetical protein CQA53_09115 [Helicobacter didelphidarum]|uniref:Periplasmic protein n=2 Tax=Helicobacter didelphidarum TaxID=2040648 RepID=A0A3D8ID62_9HELI|nr:hypothetical protein CQA53_09115 [Helicobacter didelphidarum]